MGKTGLLFCLVSLSEALSFAQGYGPNYVGITYSQKDNQIYPKGAATLLTNNPAIRQLRNDISDIRDQFGGYLDVISGGPLFTDFARLVNWYTNRTGDRAIFKDVSKTYGNTVADRIIIENSNYIRLDWSKFEDVKSKDGSSDTNDIQWILSDNLVMQKGDPLAIPNTGTYPNTNSWGIWWNDPAATNGEFGFRIGGYTCMYPFEKPENAQTKTNYLYSGSSGLRAQIDSDLYNLNLVPGKSFRPYWSLGTNGQYNNAIGWGNWSNAVVASTTNLLWNTNCWIYGMDLSCVSPGWIPYSQTGDWVPVKPYDYATSNYAQHVYLVTRQHVVGCDHWHMGYSKATHKGRGELVFLDQSNNVCKRKLINDASDVGGHGDCWMGMLDEPVPESFHPAKIIRLEDVGKIRQALYGKLTQDGFRSEPSSTTKVPSKYHWYLNAIHFRYSAARFVWYNFDSVTNSITSYAKTNYVGKYSFLSDRYGPAHNDLYGFVGGDSSTAILLWINGQTVLVQTVHTSSGTGPNITKLAPAIEAQIQEWGNSEYTTLHYLDLSGYPDYSDYEPE